MPIQDSVFPRGMRLPTQSPLFWVHNKDRYLRQLLISDIEGDTGRSLIVYFTDCASNAQIDHMDDAYLVEQLLGAVQQNGVDLLLETNGGMTDATEKIVSVLANLAKDLRVIVPRRAKSNGTVIALTGKSILMGANSELGPIDPYIPLGPNGLVPAAFIINAQSQVDPLVFQIAQSAMNQTKKLATNVLKAGMLANIDVQRIEEDIVVKLSSRNHYHSHGSVIDHKEAAELGLEVEYLPPENELWQKIWLLRTMYEHDCKVNRLSKLFEGNKISSGISV